MQESFSFSPNSLILSDTGRRILKLSLILRCISPWIKAVIYRVHDEVWVPLRMDISSAWRDHGGPVCVGMPYST